MSEGPSQKPTWVPSFSISSRANDSLSPEMGLKSSRIVGRHGRKIQTAHCRVTLLHMAYRPESWLQRQPALPAKGVHEVDIHGLGTSALPSFSGICHQGARSHERRKLAMLQQLQKLQTRHTGFSAGSSRSCPVRIRLDNMLENALAVVQRLFASEPLPDTPKTLRSCSGRFIFVQPPDFRTSVASTCTETMLSSGSLPISLSTSRRPSGRRTRRSSVGSSRDPSGRSLGGRVAWRKLHRRAKRSRGRSTKGFAKPRFSTHQASLPAAEKRLDCVWTS